MATIIDIEGFFSRGVSNSNVWRLAEFHEAGGRVVGFSNELETELGFQLQLEVKKEGETGVSFSSMLDGFLK